MTQEHQELGTEAAKLRDDLAKLKLAYGELFNQNVALTGWLEALYDKWENGIPCYEYSAEPSSSSIGNAFKLSYDEENQIIAAIIGAKL
jgi:hypothetical protein